MMIACTGFTAIAVALGQLEVPHGRTVWAALLVTGVFASALAYLTQTWAQRSISAARTALIYAMEPVFAGFFGYLLAGDRLGALGWAGCAVILAGIIVSEPQAAAVLIRLTPRRSSVASRRDTG
jgi:drug/metabolite transporter (DMT)-like permease